MAELITITDGNKVITVTKKAFSVIYKRYGFQVYKEKTEEISKEKIEEKNQRELLKRKNQGRHLIVFLYFCFF